MTLHSQNFIKLLDKIKPSKHRYEIFNDWLVLTSAALSNWKKDKSIEDEYLQVADQYTKEELEHLSALFQITVDALEEKVHDFLGEVFTFGELTNSRTGQFFTPYHISYMMAEIAIGEKEIPQNRVIRITDPCCGAGGMLVAAASVMKNNGINFQQDVFFLGTDIDPRCARMTYIQMSLLGAPAVIICGNSLSFEVFWQRETIMYFISGMNYRLRAEEMIENTKKIICEEIETKHEPKQIETEIKLSPSRSYVQGELF